jgi:hypothetical protein
VSGPVVAAREAIVASGVAHGLVVLVVPGPADPAALAQVATGQVARVVADPAVLAGAMLVAHVPVVLTAARVAMDRVIVIADRVVTSASASPARHRCRR